MAEQLAVRRDPVHAYRDDLSAAAREAMQAAGGAIVHDLLLGGAHVRLRLAGRALEPVLLPALRHARIETPLTNPRLTIDAWDAMGTGVGPPSFPWSPEDVRERGEIRGFNNGGLRTLYHAGGPGPDQSFRALSMVDTLAGAAWFSVASVQSVPWYERAAPLRDVLHLGLNGPGRLLVHAAAVGRGQTGMLLAGAGGVGKSTTALACVLAGLDYAGDDYVVLDLGGSEPLVHSVYGTAKIAPSGANLLRELAPKLLDVAGDDHGKLVVDLAGSWPERMRSNLPVCVLVIPSLHAGRGPHLTACSPAYALRALAPTTINQLPSVGGSALAPLSALARRVPAWSLELGDSPEAAAALLISLLEGLGVGD